MAAPFTPANLGRGPAIATYGGASFFTRDDIVSRLSPTWKPVMTSMYGEVDKYKSDQVMKVPLRLWGAWENLSILFPSGVINPVVGSSLFGGSNVSLTLLSRNGDQIVFTNAILTRLANLYLGVDSDLFAADVEFTCLRGNANNPEDADAYYTVTTGNAFSDNAFAKTNFLKVRWTGAWGTITGFTSLVAQKGWSVEWNTDVRPVMVDGWGTSDLTLANFTAAIKFVPIIPTLAQMEAEANSQGIKLGALLSANVADLTLTGGSHSLVLKNAGFLEHGYAWGIEPLRLGEMTFASTRGFTTGAPAAVATVS